MKMTVKEWRDEAVTRLRAAIRDPACVGEAVDGLVAASMAKVNSNLRGELLQIRGLVHACPEESTYTAVRRLWSEREGTAKKYKESREKMNKVIADLKQQIRDLESR